MSYDNKLLRYLGAKKIQGKVGLTRKPPDICTLYSHNYHDANVSFLSFFFPFNKHSHKKEPLNNLFGHRSSYGSIKSQTPLTIETVKSHHPKHP